MPDIKFEAVLTILIPQIIQLVLADTRENEMAAVRAFYSSETYAVLEREDTKLWHLSPHAIYEIYKSEAKTGMPELPEEA